MVLAHLVGNRAAVYGLRIPLTPAEALNRALEQLVMRLAADLADQAAATDATRRPLSLPAVRRRPPRRARPGHARRLVRAARAGCAQHPARTMLTSSNRPGWGSKWQPYWVWFCF